MHKLGCQILILILISYICPILKKIITQSILLIFFFVKSYRYKSNAARRNMLSQIGTYPMQVDVINYYSINIIHILFLLSQIDKYPMQLDVIC